MNPHMKSFATRLTDARKAAGLIQKDAAQLLRVGQSTLEKWETGDRTPKPLMQEAVLRKLQELSLPQKEA